MSERIALGLEYDGSSFHGFEAQRNTRTVQGVLEHALSRIADQPIRTICAGRTDAGVHALAQVVHFDVSVKRPQRAWVMGTNTHLPRDVAVLWAREVDATFHARFSALGRRYRYLILNRRTRPAVLSRRVTWMCRPLDVLRMREAAQSLLGEHDFSAFRAAGCQARTPVRTLRQLQVVRDGDLIIVHVAANAFLQHMVRNLVGVLAAIGEGRQPVQWAAEVLASRDRKAGGVTAPAHGLYLSAVKYPQAFAMPDLSPPPVLW